MSTITMTTATATAITAKTTKTMTTTLSTHWVVLGLAGSTNKLYPFNLCMRGEKQTLPNTLNASVLISII